MDPWKRYRLLACIVAILAFLAVGTFARLVWGVPDKPYGSFGFHGYCTANPFDTLAYHYALWQTRKVRGNDPPMLELLPFR